MLLDGLNSKSRLEEVSNKYGLGCELAILEIGPEEISQVESFKKDFEIVTESGEYNHFSHANPWGDDTHIYENSSEELLKKFDAFPEGCFYVGHSHYQFILNRDKRKIISVGSVGQNRKKGGLACWASLSSSGEVDLRQTIYDISKTQNMVKDNDPNKKYLRKVLSR
jgi:hypothetical protein